MNKSILFFLFLFLSGCATLTFNGVHNPNKVAKDQLAKISHGKSFGELFGNDSVYEIVAVDGVRAPSSSRFTKFEAGLYVIDWEFRVTEDLGIATYRVATDGGKLVVRVDSGTKYIIGSNPEPGGGAAIYIKAEDEAKEIVSLNCEQEECEGMKNKINSGNETIASLKKKIYLQSVLDSLKDPVLPNLAIGEGPKRVQKIDE